MKMEIKVWITNTEKGYEFTKSGLLTKGRQIISLKNLIIGKPKASRRYDVEELIGRGYVGVYYVREINET